MEISNKRKIVTQVLFVIAFFGLWQIVYMSGRFSELLFPSVPQVIEGLIRGFASEDLGGMVLYSMSLIVKGLAAGIFLAFLFSGLSIIFKTFHVIYNLIVSVFDLIPGVALIPLAILWFGVGEASIIFIVIHSVIWPMSRSIIDGFSSVPQIYVESGMNIGLLGARLLTGVYIPAAFSSILSGMKVGWARAWRGLISAEMIFGTTGSGAGIGWFIMTKRINMKIEGVFASIIVIIIIGVVVEYLVFRTLDKHTVRKWGMVR